MSAASTMAPSTSPAGATSQPVRSYRESLSAAAERAMARGLTVRRKDATSWSVEGRDYTVTEAGPAPTQVSCDCPAGMHGLVCYHIAPVIFGRKYGVHFVSCRVPCQPAPEVAPSTPEEVALSESVKAEIIAEMAGVAAGAGEPCRHEYNDSNGPDFTCKKCGHFYTYEPEIVCCEHGVDCAAFCAPCHHKAVDAAIEVRRAQDKAWRIAGYRAELASGANIFA